ncbi:MAG: hypothetical protein ACE5FG_03525 [Myxococcota bacterium]
MTDRTGLLGALIALALALPISAGADIKDLVRCQKRFASAGARFANRSIKLALKCTNAISSCQIQCEQGVFGPPCSVPPEPGCCDVNDPNSNAAYSGCLDQAGVTCAEQTARIADEEVRKQQKIINACDDLTSEELCGAQAVGLNFAALDAGCLALDPNYTCTLNNLIDCVGGTLERVLTDQVTSLLDPRAPEGIAELGIGSSFPGIPVARKVREDLPSARVDVWSFSGSAGELVSVRVKPIDDDADGVATLQPSLTLIDLDGVTPLGDTTIETATCPIPTVCGGGCPRFQRHLPFSGTFFLAIEASVALGCGGGPYRLIVTSESGGVPVLVADDVDPSTVLP